MSQTPSPSNATGPQTESTSLFGIHTNRLNARRQSVSRVYQVAAPTSSVQDDSDDEGIITIDPLTHKTSVVRGTETVSKEALDRLDGRGALGDRGGQMTGSGRYSAHRGSISGPSNPPQTNPNQSQSGSFPTFDKNGTGMNYTTPGVPITGALNFATEGLKFNTVLQDQDQFLFNDITVPSLNTALQTSIRSRRRPSMAGGLRSPGIRGESVLRNSIKTGLLDHHLDHHHQSSESDIFSPSTHQNLPNSIDIDEIAVQEDQRDIKKAVVAIQQSILTELNYHYLHATPSVPVNTPQQSKLPNLALLQGAHSSISPADFDTEMDIVLGTWGDRSSYYCYLDQNEKNFHNEKNLDHNDKNLNYNEKNFPNEKKPISIDSNPLIIPKALPSSDFAFFGVSIEEKRDVEARDNFQCQIQSAYCGNGIKNGQNGQNNGQNGQNNGQNGQKGQNNSQNGQNGPNGLKSGQNNTISSLPKLHIATQNVQKATKGFKVERKPLSEVTNQNDTNDKNDKNEKNSEKSEKSDKNSENGQKSEKSEKNDKNELLDKFTDDESDQDDQDPCEFGPYQYHHRIDMDNGMFPKALYPKFGANDHQRFQNALNGPLFSKNAQNGPNGVIFSPFPTLDDVESQDDADGDEDKGDSEKDDEKDEKKESVGDQNNQNNQNEQNNQNNQKDEKDENCETNNKNPLHYYQEKHFFRYFKNTFRPDEQANYITNKSGKVPVRKLVKKKKEKCVKNDKNDKNDQNGAEKSQNDQNGPENDQNSIQTDKNDDKINPNNGGFNGIHENGPEDDKNGQNNGQNGQNGQNNGQNGQNGPNNRIKPLTIDFDDFSDFPADDPIDSDDDRDEYEWVIEWVDAEKSDNDKSNDKNDKNNEKNNEKNDKSNEKNDKNSHHLTYDNTTPLSPFDEFSELSTILYITSRNLSSMPGTVRSVIDTTRDKDTYLLLSNNITSASLCGLPTPNLVPEDLALTEEEIREIILLQNALRQRDVDGVVITKELNSAPDLTNPSFSASISANSTSTLAGSSGNIVVLGDSSLNSTNLPQSMLRETSSSSSLSSSSSSITTITPHTLPQSPSPPIMAITTPPTPPNGSIGTMQGIPSLSNSIGINNTTNSTLNSTLTSISISTPSSTSTSLPPPPPLHPSTALPPPLPTTIASTDITPTQTNTNNINTTTNANNINNINNNNNNNDNNNNINSNNNNPIQTLPPTPPIAPSTTPVLHPLPMSSNSSIGDTVPPITSIQPSTSSTSTSTSSSKSLPNGPNVSKMIKNGPQGEEIDPEHLSSNFYMAMEDHASHIMAVAQPLLDRNQLKLEQYELYETQYAHLNVAERDQLAPRHYGSQLFLLGIFPQAVASYIPLSTAPNAATTTLHPSTSHAGASFGTILATKQQYTWMGSHNRQALKKRRVQVLRFALNDAHYIAENAQDAASSAPMGPNRDQNQIQAGFDDSDSDLDENILYTHHSVQAGMLGAYGKTTKFTSSHQTNPVTTSTTAENVTPPESPMAASVASAVGTQGTTVKAFADCDLGMAEISENEFHWQQRNARKLMVRATVPTPNDVVLEATGTGEVMSTDEAALGDVLPLPYSTSGVATLDFMSKQLDNRQSKDIMKGKRLLATMTEAYLEDNPQKDEGAVKVAEKPSLFHINKNKRLHDDMTGLSTATNPTATSTGPLPNSGIHQVSGLNYNTPLKSVLVNGLTDMKKQQALQHLHNMAQYEELCKKRMRQGCFVIKYKLLQPTKRFLYLSHNDTMLSWRELTSKEEKKFDIWNSMSEEWKEVAVAQELAQIGDGSGTNDDGEEADGYYNEEEFEASTIVSSNDPSNVKDKREKKKSSRWTNFLSNSTTFKSTKHFPIDDIKQIFYGPFVAMGFQAFVEQCRKSNAKPWYATTIQTPTETLNIVFLCNYDVTLWLQGLYMLAPSTGKAFTLGKMLWLRTIMKINFVGYNDFVFNNQQQQHQQTVQQQQAIQQSRREDTRDEMTDSAGELSILGQRTVSNVGEDFHYLSQPEVSRISSISSISSSTYHGSTTVAALKPIVSLNSVPQIFCQGSNADWTDKVTAPGSNDMSKYRPTGQ